MKLNSMTGYGHGAAIRRGLRADVEISSVNRRQLDIHVSAPKNMSGLEPAVIKMVSTVLCRGSVTVTVRLTISDGGAARICADSCLAVAYLNSLRKLSKELGLPADVALADVVAFPDVIRPWHSDLSSDEAWECIKPALAQGLKRLDGMRSAEGNTLGRDLLGRFAVLARLLGKIRALLPRVIAARSGRIRAILEKAGADPRIAVGEAALQAEKADITEETTRLDSHIASAVRSIKAGGECGRTLDFIVQEIIREINTIGAKASDSRMSAVVVKFKAETEKIREQVQNIE